jgi:hypothetical protein
MKKIIFGFLFFLSVQVFSQNNVTFKIFIEDSKSNVDSLIIGILDSSSLGVDSFLGEKNIYGSIYDTLEIRSIQRTETNYHCLTNARDYFKIYSSENLDLKIDFRPSNPTKPYGEYLSHSLNHNFEIIFRAINFPVYIYAYSQHMGTYFLFSYISTIDDQCSTIKLHG